MARVTTDATVFGSAAIASLGLDLDERGSASIDVSFTFEQALRLHFALAQALAAMNAEQRPEVVGASVAAQLRIDTRRRQLTIALGDAVAQHPGEAIPGLGVDTNLTGLNNLPETGPIEVEPPPAPRTARAAPKRESPKEPPADKRRAKAPEPEPEPAPARKAESRRAASHHDKTLERALKAFLEQYPNGFMDPDFVEQHRSSPALAHQRYLETLGGDRGELLLAAGDLDTLVHSAIEVILESRLLSRAEANAFRSALGDEDAAHAYFRGFFAVVSDFEPNERSFRPYAMATETLALEYIAGTAAWPLATVLPHLSRPEVFAFVDPSPVRRCADRLDFNLNYSSELNWATYNRVLRMCDAVMQRIGALGARDLIDLCAFLRVVEDED